MQISFGTRVFDILTTSLQRHPQKRLLNAKRGESWLSFSTEEFSKLVRQLAMGFVHRGLVPGDRVALCANGCPEWNIVDYACQQAGLVSVPLYVNLNPRDYGYILAQAEVKLAIVANAELYDTLQEAGRLGGHSCDIFTLEPASTLPYWEQLLPAAHKLSPAQQDALNQEVERRMDETMGDSLCTIIFTSGTTGTPNGVMLSHRNLLSNVEAGIEHMPVNTGDRFLSFLPPSHAFERTVLNIMIGGGVETWYAENLERVGANLKEVKPHLFTTVPRMLEKVYDRILQRGYGLKGIKKALFFWALNLGLQYKPGKAHGGWYMWQLGIARKLIFSKWLEALGGEVKAIVVGGAALQERLGSVFWAAGISVMEGYGLTECAPVVSVNHMREAENRVGTVGIPLKGVLVKLAEDGEILVKSPGVFQGYYKNPDKTADSFTTDGWLKTGDIGTWVEDQFLKITDRKKDMFKTSGGKYIAPAVIENLLKQSLLVEQAMVLGDGRNFVAALITPTWDRLRDWCAIHNLVWTTDLDMVSHPEVLRKLHDEVAAANAQLSQFEQVKKFVLLPDNWAIESGELTATMKLKRRVIMEKYHTVVEGIYAG